jgi:hypothetical protein
VEELKMSNHNQTKKISLLDNEVKILHDENNYLKADNLRLNEDLCNKDKIINAIHNDYSEKDLQYQERIAELEKKLEYTTTNFQNLMEKYEKVEIELTENIVVIFYKFRNLKKTLRVGNILIKSFLL